MRRVESQGESLRCLSSRKQPAIYGIHSDAGGDGDSREPCQGHAVGRGCHWAVALGDLPAQSGSLARGVLSFLPKLMRKLNWRISIANWR